MELVHLILEHLTIKDGVDIILVAFFIYQVLIIIQGTRAVQVLIGLGVLITVYWLAVSYKLYALDWILAHFFNSFFLIIIILFQEQIKMALAHFGAGQNFVGKRTGLNLDREIEEIVEATITMSKEKMGALIVLERTQGLLNFIATGTSIKSDIHADLLYSLFIQRSPLHDGAVIIRKNKIAAAGCFLPLSKSSEIHRHFGTRHRAGMGVSEVTDAIAIIVSEERGDVKIAVDGEIKECPNQLILREFLRKYLLGEKGRMISREQKA